MAGPWIFNRVRYERGAGFDFEAGTGLWLLVDRDTWTPNEDNDWIADILAAGATEPATTGDRQTITNPTNTLDDANNRSLWGADDFTYPGVPNASPFDTLVLANFVTNDSDSWLMGAWDLGALTGDGNPIAISITGGYLFAW